MSIFVWILLVSSILGAFSYFAYYLSYDYYIKHKVYGIFLAICIVTMIVNIPLAIIDKTKGQKETWTQQEIIVSKWAEIRNKNENKFFLSTDSGIDFKVSGRTYGKYEKGDEVVVRYERIYGKFSNHLYERVEIDEGE